MKKYLISILSFFIFVSTSVLASAADKVTLQLQWFTQAQFFLLCLFALLWSSLHALQAGVHGPLVIIVVLFP